MAVEKQQQSGALVGGDLNTNYGWYMCVCACVCARASTNRYTLANTPNLCINQRQCESQRENLACKHKHQGNMLRVQKVGAHERTPRCGNTLTGVMWKMGVSLKQGTQAVLFFF